MNPSTAYDSDFRELSAQQNSLQVDQQSSYFLARWQTGPLDLSLEIQETNFPLTQGPSALDPASMPPLTRHSSESSPTSSEMSRRHSQDPFPKQKQDRRRAQNRAAQRAYRERKEQLRYELEIQVKDWQERHRILRESYADQSQEVQRLRRELDKLQTQLLTLQDSNNIPDYASLGEFDLWPDLDWKAA